MSYAGQHTPSSRTEQPLPRRAPTSRAITAATFAFLDEVRDRESIRRLPFPVMHPIPLTSEPMPLTGRAPLMPQHKVVEYFGVALGDLVAVVMLPGKESYFTVDPAQALDQYPVADSDRVAIPMLIFNPHAGARHITPGSAEYYCMGLDDIDAVRDGRIEDVSAYSVSAGSSFLVGRNHWLPNLGRNSETQFQADPELARRYSSIGGTQAEISVTSSGDVSVHDLGRLNHAWVYSGPVQAAAVTMPAA